MLSSGTKLGPYEITGRLGAGGTGEVYRATDRRLGRDVAIKLLLAPLSGDPDQKLRFEREARLISSLNHPNICQLYDIASEAGTEFIVMELLEGETLADRIERAAIPVAEALRIAREIAEGLEYAHERGIIHRDLKPANIKLAANERVKILDFGLAKALQADAVHNPPTSSATVSFLATKANTILGTPAYMSPEQARGAATDRRTDIWAFGCILYELLTRRRAFEGPTASDTIATVLSAEPDWNALPPAMPENITRLIQRCLQKSSARRLRDIGDARLEIEEAQSQDMQSAASRYSSAASIAAPARAVTRFSIALPAEQSLLLRVGSSVAVSPDGGHLVYVSSRAGKSLLYLRPLDRFEATAIPGTEGAEGPFFSPDGQWVGFFADHKLKKIALHGGTPFALCTAPVCLGASWGPSDKIIFASSPDSGLLQVPATGGAPEVLTVSDSRAGECGHYWPEILPDGSALLYTTVLSNGSPRITLRRSDSGTTETLIEGGTNPRYATSGHLLYAWGPDLYAARFDVNTLRLTGSATPVLQGVLGTVFAGAQFAVSPIGTIAYVTGQLQRMNRRMVWVDRSGATFPAGAPLRPYLDPRISPDGREVAVTIHDGTREDIWSFDFERGTLSRVTSEGFENETPIWSPDGKNVLLGSSRIGPPMTVFRASKSGIAGEEELFSADHHIHLNSISPNGEWLAYTEYDHVRGGNIWLAQLPDARMRRPVLQRHFHDWGAQFSPDGKWMAYVSNESGCDDIYVLAFPDLNRKWQISTDGGTEPTWSRSGRELFYRSGNRMMMVEVVAAQEFSPQKPVLLFEGDYERGLTLGHTNYDVAPDGQRFLMLKADEEQASAAQLNVVLNWFQEFG